MSYNTQPQDASLVPVAAGYQPGNSWSAILGSGITHIDGASNTGAGLITSDSIREFIILGKGFSAALEVGSAGASNYFPVSIFNPSGSTKTLLVYSVRALHDFGYGGIFAAIHKTTTDPAYPTSVTPINLKFGSSTTSSSNITYTTTQVSSTAAVSTRLQTVNNQYSFDMLTNGVVFILPATFGITTYVYINSGKQFNFEAKWIEF